MIRIVIDSILPHAKIGRNDHRKDAPRLCLGVQVNLFKDYQASSSNDRKQLGSDRRRSTGSVREEVNPIKCKFYKSAGDESSVERREFEVWNGSIHEQIGPLDIYVR